MYLSPPAARGNVPELSPKQLATLHAVWHPRCNELIHLLGSDVSIMKHRVWEINKCLCFIWAGRNGDMQHDAASGRYLDGVWSNTTRASRQIDRCVLKFPMGQDRIAEQRNEARQQQGERGNSTARPATVPPARHNYSPSLLNVPL